MRGRVTHRGPDKPTTHAVPVQEGNAMKSPRVIATPLLGLLLLASPAWGFVVVDNEDGSPAYVETGGWSTGSAVGYDGGTYRFATPGGSSTATWTGTFAEAGNHEIFVWFIPGSNRSPSTCYEVHAADGTHTVYVDQRKGGWTFDSLGTFPFNAGSASVTLNATASSGGEVVIADAVRFGVDDTPPPPPPTPTQISPGVYQSEWHLPGPVVAHVVEFELADPQYTIEMGFAEKKRNYTNREVLTDLGARYDETGHEVLAAINCAFFDFDTIFLNGVLGSNSNLIGQPNTSLRETYMLEGNGEGWCAQDLPNMNAVARFADDATMSVGVLNYMCGSNTLVLYTPDWGPRTASTVQGVEVIVENVNYPLRPNKTVVGTITAVQTGAASVNNLIPAGGFVLAACPGKETELLSHASVGDTVAIDMGLLPLELNNAQMLTAANGWIAKDGAPFPGGWYMGFYNERHPRTVLAWTGTKHWFIAIDGRQPGYSAGMMFSEMADFVIDKLGADNAINLDGGGSTTLVINGALVNCVSSGATPPCTGTMRPIPNALMLIKRDAESLLPLIEDFGAAGRALPWDEKFGFDDIAPFAPTAPDDGDGYVMQMLNPVGGFESASVGDAGDTDYLTEAMVWCEYRPDVASDGFERVGVFAHDDGNALFESTDLGGGNCYALTYDSNDGRIRAGVVIGGVFTDFLEAEPLYMPSSAWRKLRINCHGTSIRFSVNGHEIANVTDTSHTTGRAGIGYHEYFTSDANMHGARVDRFKMFKTPFDYNGDGAVTLADLPAFGFCLGSSGPAKPYVAQLCRTMDENLDSVVDLHDFAEFQLWLTAN